MDITTILASKYKLDKRIVQGVISSVYAFTVDRMQDELDTTTIMLRYVGKFKIKSKFKDNKLYPTRHVRSIKA